MLFLCCSDRTLETCSSFKRAEDTNRHACSQITVNYISYCKGKSYRITGSQSGVAAPQWWTYNNDLFINLPGVNYTITSSVLMVFWSLWGFFWGESFLCDSSSNQVDRSSTHSSTLHRGLAAELSALSRKSKDSWWDFLLLLMKNRDVKSKLQFPFKCTPILNLICVCALCVV